MDQGTGAQVRPPQNGSSNGMTQNGAGMDDGTGDDLDTRLNQRIEGIASGFRSTIDKRFAPIERVAQTVPQLQAQIGQMSQQLTQMQQYFTTAQEADLDPDERERRQMTRQQQDSMRREQALAFNARQQNAAFRVSTTLADMGFKWNDSRLDWSRELYDSDPDIWASTVVSNAARVYAQELSTQQNQRETQVVDVAKRRAQEIQTRQNVVEQNAQRGAQAQTIETQVPGGPQMDWMDKVRNMTPTERQEWIRKQQSRIRHGEINLPGQ